MTQLNRTRKLLICMVAAITAVAGMAVLQHWHVRAQSPSQTMLVFDYVTTVPGFDTGLAITNASRTPMNAGQSGTCSLTYYGTIRNGSALPTGLNTPEIPAGAQLAFVVSFGGYGITPAPGFQGYVVAICNFPSASGVAGISDAGAVRFLSVLSAKSSNL